MYKDILENEGNFTRKQLTFLYVIKTLDELRDLGIIEGGQYQMTEVGLKNLGDFKPTEDEITEIMFEMKAEGMI